MSSLAQLYTLRVLTLPPWVPVDFIDRCENRGMRGGAAVRNEKAAGIFALRPTGLKIAWFYKMGSAVSPGPQRLSQNSLSGESKVWFQPRNTAGVAKLRLKTRLQRMSATARPERPPTEVALYQRP